MLMRVAERLSCSKGSRNHGLHFSSLSPTDSCCYLLMVIMKIIAKALKFHQHDLCQVAPQMKTEGFINWLKHDLIFINWQEKLTDSLSLAQCMVLLTSLVLSPLKLSVLPGLKLRHYSWTTHTGQRLRVMKKKRFVWETKKQTNKQKQNSILCDNRRGCAAQAWGHKHCSAPVWLKWETALTHYYLLQRLKIQLVTSNPVEWHPGKMRDNIWI